MKKKVRVCVQVLAGKNRINLCYKIPSGCIKNRVIVLRFLSALCWSGIFLAVSGAQ